MVYRAVDADRDRKVALKLLLPELLGALPGDEALRRMREAAEPSNFLNHPGISRVRDVGFENEFHFACVDYVDGESVFDLISQHGPFPLPEALRVVMDVLGGLGYAHEQGVLHGDVKLENVMLRATGTGVLTDYGTLRDFAAEGAPPEERWICCMTSLAPEVILGEEASPASDLYGVGMVLYELLTGDSAFPVRDGEDPWQAARRRVEHPPPQLPRHERSLPLELNDVFSRALARDPRSRYESAADMTRALIAMAVRYRLEIPDKVPLDTVPACFESSRKKVRESLLAAGSPMVEPDGEGGDLTEETVRGLERRRVQGWFGLGMCAVLLLGTWVVLGARVSYLSVSTFPAGARVTLITLSETGGETTEVLGEEEAGFRPVLAGTRRLRVEWEGNPPRVVNIPAEGKPGIELKPRTHLQVNVSRDGGTAIRRLHVPMPGLDDLELPDVGSWFSSLMARLGGESLDVRSAEVDEEADRLLAGKKLEEAVQIYRKRIEMDPELRRLVADRMIEVAWLRRESDRDWAVESLKQAVRIDPDHGRGRVILGELLHQAGDGDALFHLHKAAQRLLPARLKGLPSGNQAALDEIHERMGMNPDEPTLLRWEAHYLRQLKRTGEATEKYLALARSKSWNQPENY